VVYFNLQPYSGCSAVCRLFLCFPGSKHYTKLDLQCHRLDWKMLFSHYVDKGEHAGSRNATSSLSRCALIHGKSSGFLTHTIEVKSCPSVFESKEKLTDPTLLRI